MQNFERRYPLKIIIKFSDLTPPRVLNLESSVFIRISINPSTNASTSNISRHQTFLFMIFNQNRPENEILNCEHYEKTKRKFKILAVARVDGVMLILIKTDLSNLFLYISLNLVFLKPMLKKLIRTIKLQNQFILAYQISEH